MPRSTRIATSAGIDTTEDDVDVLLDAVARIGKGEPSPIEYEQDLPTGDWYPVGALPGWSDLGRTLGSSCARG